MTYASVHIDELREKYGKPLKALSEEHVTHAIDSRGDLEGKMLMIAPWQLTQAIYDRVRARGGRVFVSDAFRGDALVFADVAAIRLDKSWSEVLDPEGGHRWEVA